ncbi:transducin family protein / WD-40 repeat family protein, partial [Striga asiatica]
MLLEAGAGLSLESSDSNEDEGEYGSGPGSPILQLPKVPHVGGMDRIRAMRQNPHICASWADTGHMWGLSSQLKSLVESEAEAIRLGPTDSNQAPIVRFSGQKDEGYAMDWSPLIAGRFASGDCKSSIHLREPASDSTWNIDASPFVGHNASVEDLQWSPTEPFVFTSCSVDGSIVIWDA